MNSTPPPRRATETRLTPAAYAVAAAALAVYAATPTGAAEMVGRFTATMAGAICLGGVVLILIIARPDDRGVIDAAAFRAHLVVERLSVVWAVVALMMIVVQAAADAGVAVTRLLGSGKLTAAIGASETSRAWVLVAVCAIVIAIASRLSLRWEWHVPLLIPSIVGVVAVAVTGDAGQGPNHDYATSSAIVFAVAISVWAGLMVVGAATPVDTAARGRVGLAAATAAAVALGYGSLLLTLRAGVGDLLGSPYGRLGLFIGVALAACLTVRRMSTGLPGAVVAIAAMAAWAAMAAQTAPRLLATKPTVWDILLGYQLPGAPTPSLLLSFWRFDTFLGAGALVLGGAYVFGVTRLHRRGDRWPIGRTLSWLAGCTAMFFATGSGVRSYGSAMFSVHMVEHMTLNMFVPVLLVLGAPVTLALRVLPSAGPGSPPGPREWIVRAVHSPFTAFLSNPITAFVLFVGSLYVVYFTPLFDTLVRYHWGHEFMAVHFLLTGYLFYWGIIGVDPGPRRLPYIGRLALLFAIMPFHAFFGIATMSMTSPLGGNFYRSLALPWVHSLTDDQHLGGAIAWGASEVPLVMVVVALVTQWARQDRRTSTRSDRHADAGFDDELDAYNNMLRELARQRTSE